MSYRFEQYPDRDLMMLEVASRMAGALKEAILVNGQASFAVPGGSTPGPIFDALCAADLDWSKVTVLPGDERWVDEASEHSNARQIRSRLLVERAAEANFLPLFTGEEGAEAVAGLEAALAAHMPLSLVLLGMGGDMHTASLFPGEAALRPESRNSKALLHYVKVPGLDPRVPRITLSVQAINDAMSKHVVLTGADKRAAFEEAVRLGDPYQAPISAVLSGATVHWAE
ncbi:6-phosphogluconolactonase [Candidatus Rhodobacter oscarellae]|uniref:6-phosphogluconolactonase n=1 Tax=Candidatus Rhodobacter oscarellae TaxID=1675527 RepID=A0A0J9E3Z5_9RHOB|nr:6-phosphogluconolactonase [Candidatus Rhodobacter lobularis]KMW57510.1 6-phosphogluconolactonase [Candidatus Rhodobacter lobularis]